MTTLGSLFTGYGGLDIAVQQHYGADLAWYAEIDRHASTVLAAHHPGVPNLGDITTIDWEGEEVMPAPRNDALAQHMYDRYCQGLSLQQVAAEFNRTRQTVWKMFRRRGWDMRQRPPARPAIDYGGLIYSLGDLGYYRCTTGDRDYLHRKVWADHHGAIPHGFDVHHRDHDKTNNDAANLALLTKTEHARLHAEEVVPSDSPGIDILTGGYP